MLWKWYDRIESIGADTVEISAQSKRITEKVDELSINGDQQYSQILSELAVIQNLSKIIEGSISFYKLKLFLKYRVFGAFRETSKEEYTKLVELLSIIQGHGDGAAKKEKEGEIES